MAQRHKTEYQIKQIMKYNRDGSPDRQSTRLRHLMQFIKGLQDRGYSQRWDVHKIGKKEVNRIMRDWKDQGLTPRTIANKMVDIRWLASKVNRADQIPSNKQLGVGLRSSQPGFGENKACELKQEWLDNMDERMKLINELKAEFGLREKESLRFESKYATSESSSYIKLKKKWCKSKKERIVAITNDKQRDLLKRIKEFQARHNEHNMIPKNSQYLSYKKQVQAKSTALGFKGHHLRHHWAQQRFEQISGMKPPIAGGPEYSSLSDKEKALWRKAARTVNEELGHGKGREDNTATYIGKKT